MSKTRFVRYRCDRCGVTNALEITRGEGDGDIEIPYLSLSDPYPGGWKQFGDKDLCPKCGQNMDDLLADFFGNEG